MTQPDPTPKVEAIYSVSRKEDMSVANALATNYRNQYRVAHEWLEGTMEGLTSEQANYFPEGRTLSAGANYAHHIQGLDAIVNGMLRGAAPLMAGDFAGKIGTETPAPQGDWSEWARTTPVDVDAARAYGKAVIESADAYLANLSDSDLAAEIDLSSWGMGNQPTTFLLDVMLMDTSVHTGEISAVKGLQGLQGYPF